MSKDTLDTENSQNTPPELCPLVSEFNNRASHTHEVEIKFLVPDNDTAVFDQIETFFYEKGWIQFNSQNNNLVTRQLDMPDNLLLKGGTTIRVRGTSQNQDLDEANSPDICVKTGKTKDPSGAVRRGEYEARISHFSQTSFEALYEKYPKDEHPELYEALKQIEHENLQEFFRIDCCRSRYVIDIPESETGLKDKRVVAELLLDDVVFVVDIPGLEMPLVFYEDMEVECEVLFKACEYNQHPDAHKHISTPMSREELDQALSTVKDLLQEATGGKLVEHHDSKAERGFKALRKTLKTLAAYFGIDMKRDKTAPNETLRMVFSDNNHSDNAPAANDNDKNDLPLYQQIQELSARAMERRPLARRKIQPE